MKKTPLAASLFLTALASTGTSVVWSGFPFIAKQYYEFNAYENYALLIVIGLVYVFSAFASSNTTAFANRLISSRTILALLLFVQGVVCALPLLYEGAWVIWCAGIIAGFCSAWLWPLTESYLVAGRHGEEMRRAIGWWNLVWMIAVAIAMILIAELMEEHASMAIVGLGVANICAIFALPWFSAEPAEHNEIEVNANVPEKYKSLLKGARVLLPLSYILNGVLAPILPFVFSRFMSADEIGKQVSLASIWMVSRVLVVIVMSRIPKWHGRWSTLWIAGIAMSLGFLGVLIAYDSTILLISLGIFGLGIGATYYLAIYYAMSVGRAGIDASGTHEALIGGGYTIGPILGLSTVFFADSVDLEPFFSLGTVTMVLVGLSFCYFFAIWLKDR